MTDYLPLESGPPYVPPPGRSAAPRTYSPGNYAARFPQPKPDQRRERSQTLIDANSGAVYAQNMKDTLNRDMDDGTAGWMARARTMNLAVQAHGQAAREAGFGRLGEGGPDREGFLYNSDAHSQEMTHHLFTGQDPDAGPPRDTTPGPDLTGAGTPDPRCPCGGFHRPEQHYSRWAR